jgi:Tol biopolymer transport system component
MVTVVLFAAACRGDGGEPTVSPSGAATATASVTPTTATESPTPSPWNLEPLDVTEELGVYLVGADGSGLMQLAEGMHVPALSPDGSRVAVSDFCSTQSTVRVFDVRTGELQASRPFDGMAGAGWAPDGDRLLLSLLSEESPREPVYYMMRSDLAGEPDLAFKGWLREWSPDGRWIALVIGDGDATDWTLEIFDVEAESTVGAPLGQVSAVVWSPDGSQLAYSVMVERGGPERVMIAEADGSMSRVLAEDAELRGWSADGSSIYVVTALGSYESRQLVQIPVDAGSEVVVADGGSFEVSADGSRVAVYKNPGDGSTSIEVLDVRTGSSVLVSEGLSPHGLMWFSPDGSKLAFTAGAEDRPDGTGGFGNNLFVVSSDGSSRLRLIDPSSAVSAWLQWTPDGERIVFTDAIVTSCLDPWSMFEK